MPLTPAAAPPPGLIGNLAGTAVTVGAADTTLLVAAVPPGALVVGEMLRAKLLGVSASTGTLIFKVHFGPLGTVADPAAWTSITSAAQVTNQRAGFDAVLNLRSIGAGGTAVCEGLGFAQAALLPTVVAASATVAANTTGALFVTLSATCSFNTFTALLATVEAL